MTDNVNTLKDGLPEGISAALDKLLANPQLMGMVASALKDSSPTPTSEQVASEASPPESVPASATASDPPVFSPDAILPLIGKLSRTSESSGNAKHEALLCAIKPYLNPKRCQAIDGIIRISKMSAIVKQLK